MERLVDFRNWTGKESASIQYMAAHNYYTAMKALARAQVRILMDNTYKLITCTHTRTHAHSSFSFFFSSCIIFFLSCIIISFYVSVLSNVQQNRDILLFRVSHDTLLHRDTTSIVRRVSEAKTDCERSVPSVPPTLASPRGNHHLEKPATLRVSRPRRRKTYFTSLHRAQRTAPWGESDYNQIQPF